MRILQLNLNHCAAAQDLLNQRVRELDIDVAVLCEQYRNFDSAPWVSDSTSRAAIWACGALPIQELPATPNPGFVRAKVGGIHLYSCYVPPSAPIGEFEAFLDNLGEDVRRRETVVVAGDFNAWAIDWGCRKTDARGQILLEAFSSLNLVLLNTGMVSTFRKGAARSIIDLTFASSALTKGGYEWRVDEGFTNSDHQAVVCEINTTPTRKKRVGGWTGQSIRWNWRSFDSEAFAVVMEQHPPSLMTSAEDIAQQVTACVTKACDASMPRCRRSTRRAPVYWWSEDIAMYRRECLKARRLHQRARRRNRAATEHLRIDYQLKRSQLRRAILSSKRACWKELCEEVNRDPWGRPYKTVMHRIKALPATSPTCPVTLRRIVSHLFPEKPEIPAHLVGQFIDEEIPPVTEEELTSSRLPNGKAPGPDGIPNIALKSAMASRPDMFLHLYDACLRQGVFPSQWKQQRLVLLPKGKKPPDEPSSYRPLCMLDAAGKHLERIVADRMDHHVDPRLSENQFGFRKGRSTIDAVKMVTEIAREAISGKRWKRGGKKYCLIATLDIKNAFNSARWDRILEALARIEVPQYLRNLTAEYFRDRVLVYETEEGPAEYKVTGGVPQGSVLGPLLWNVMYDGLLHLELPEGVTLVAFADDVAVVIVCKHLEEIQAAFSTTMTIIQGWMRSVDLSLAEHKTEALLVSSRKTRETITLRVGDHTIESQPSIRYLGVLLDSRLSFKEHIIAASRKAAVVQGALSRIMPNIGGPRQSRRQLLATVVTSVLSYGAPVWEKSLHLSSYRRTMTSVQRLSAIRVASSYRTVSYEAICVIAALLPIDILAAERERLYRSKREDRSEESCDERAASLQHWQKQWSSSTNGRWTYRLIPGLSLWVNRPHGELGYYITQLLSGHGCFKQYLFRFKRANSPYCTSCAESIEDAEHVFFTCPRFAEQRRKLERVLETTISPELLVEAMLKAPEAWNATAEFAEEVLKDLRTSLKEEGE